jgi:hypothetical protein
VPLRAAGGLESLQVRDHPGHDRFGRWGALKLVYDRGSEKCL